MEPYETYVARMADQGEADWLAEIGLTAEEAAVGWDEDGRWSPPVLTVPCGCDRGRIVAEEFDGRTGRACPDCRGTGELALTAEESAVVGQFLAACRIAVAAVPVPLYPRLAA